MLNGVGIATKGKLHVASRHLIAKVATIDGLKAAVVATQDGFEIASHKTADFNALHLSALVSSLCGIGGSAGREMAIGNLRRLVLDAEDGTVIVQPISSATPVLFCVVLSRDAVLGHALWIMNALAVKFSAD